MRKINFARAHQVLTEKEMKNVLGGSDDTLCGGHGGCSGDCSWNGQSGYCTVRNDQCGCLIRLS